MKIRILLYTATNRISYVNTLFGRVSSMTGLFHCVTWGGLIIVDSSSDNKGSIRGVTE